MTSHSAVAWWSRFGGAAALLLLIPWLFAAGTARQALRWAILLVNAPPRPALQAPVAPGAAGIPRRLWLLLQEPRPQANELRPEIEWLAHRREQDRALGSLRRWLTLTVLSWFLSTAGLIACLGLAAERLFKRPDRS